MSEELARTFIDELAELPEDIPGASTMEPGRIAWLHGVNAGGAKTPGVFYGKDTAYTDTPGAPWALDERHEGEIGYSAPELKIALLGDRSQWFIPGVAKGDLPEWLAGYEEGAKKLVEYLILVDGLSEPMVLSVSGKYKAGPFADLFSSYRRGALAQLMRKHRRNFPLWAFWLPVANQRDKAGKTIYVSAQDSDGKDYNSVVTPPALVGPPILVNKAAMLQGIEIWQQFTAAGWFAFKRTPRDVVEGHVVSNAPQLPAPRNIPQPIEEGEALPF